MSFDFGAIRKTMQELMDYNIYIRFPITTKRCLPYFIFRLNSNDDTMRAVKEFLSKVVK